MTPATFDRYREIVIGGALANRGMPSFKQPPSEDETPAIEAYVLTRRAQISK